jgi:hypothetical protein
MIYQNGNKWIYEHDGEIVAVEYTYKMAKACGDARVKAMKPCTCTPNSHGVHASTCPKSGWYTPPQR